MASPSIAIRPDSNQQQRCSRKTARSRGILIAIALTLGMSCSHPQTLDNTVYRYVDFDNSGGTTAGTYEVEIEIRGALTVGEAQVRITSLGGATTPTVEHIAGSRFKFKFTVPAGGKIHDKFCITPGPTPEEKSAQFVPNTGPNQALATTPETEPLIGSDGRVDAVLVINGGNVSVTLDSLQVCTSPTLLDFANSQFYGSSVNALPWITIISAPISMAPGTTASYAVPGRPSIVGVNCYARTVYREQGTTKARNLTMGLAGHSVPLTNSWIVALMVLGLCVTGMVLLTIRGARRVASIGI